MHLIFSPRQIAQVLTVVAVVLSLISLGGQFCKYILEWGGSDLINFIDLEYEKNLPSVFATFQLLFTSLLLAMIAVDKKRTKDRYRYHWQGLSIIFLYLASDELFSIHEYLNRPIHRIIQPIFGTRWDVVNSILLPIFLLIYFKFWRSLPKQLKQLFFVSGFLYVLGAIIIEVIGLRYFPGNYFQPRFAAQIITTVEELLEMLGLNLFIYALLTYILTLSIKNISITVIDLKKTSASVVNYHHD